MAASNAVCLSNYRGVESVATKVLQELGYESLKPEQLQIVTDVLRGCDVFGVLPTGLGKLSIFFLRQAISKKRAFHCPGTFSFDNDRARSPHFFAPT